jgi:hypothetical protein
MRASSRIGVHVRSGIALECAQHIHMANCFMAGSELIHWELTALGQDGPYRLTIRHSAGTIVEYFAGVPEALVREEQLEALLIAARATAGRLAEAS